MTNRVTPIDDNNNMTNNKTVLERNKNMTEAYSYLEKPASAGKRVGKIYKELSMFHEVQTRLFTALKKCETSEAFDIYMEALKALNKVDHNPPTGEWVDSTDENGQHIRVWQNVDGTLDLSSCS